VVEFSGSDRTVAEHLIAELLDRQPDDVQQLLLRTSLLDRVNGELAELLTGRPGSERILLGLEDANASVVSLDLERRWFRYLLDRSALYGVLAEIEALGLDLVEVRRLTPKRKSSEPGDRRSP